MSLSDAWESHAANWIVWAGTVDHDAFWRGTWPELQTVLPDPGGLVIEIGCGEGRVARELSGLGHRVVGVERSVTLANAARGATPPATVVRADASRLPFPDMTADTVVACMSLHDVDDLDGTVREAARVLRPGGQLCVAMVHPFASAQDLASLHTPEPTITEPYLRERRYRDEVEHDGLAMTFESMHRPLGAYIASFAGAGFVLDTLREYGTKPIPWLLVARLAKVA